MESNLGSVLGPARSSSSAISISLRPQATRIYSRERRLNLTPTHVGHMLIVPWLLGPALLCPSRRTGSLHELQARSQVQSALLQFRAVKGFQQAVSGCLINQPQDGLLLFLVCKLESSVRKCWNLAYTQFPSTSVVLFTSWC